MNYYATKIEEKEEKRFFKTVKVKVVHARRGWDNIVTLNTPEIKRKFWKLLQKNNLNVRKKHIDIGTVHTFPPPPIEDDRKKVLFLISPSKEDMIKKHVFFQLIGISIAKLANIENDMIINGAIAEFFRKLMEKGVGEKSSIIMSIKVLMISDTFYQTTRNLPMSLKKINTRSHGHTEYASRTAQEQTSWSTPPS